jgi:hypothetical protein
LCSLDLLSDLEVVTVSYLDDDSPEDGLHRALELAAQSSSGVEELSSCIQIVRRQFLPFVRHFLHASFDLGELIILHDRVLVKGLISVHGTVSLQSCGRHLLKS